MLAGRAAVKLSIFILSKSLPFVHSKQEETAESPVPSGEASTPQPFNFKGQFPSNSR